MPLQFCSTIGCPNHSHIKGKCLVCRSTPGITPGWKGDWGRTLDKGYYCGTYFGKRCKTHRVVMTVHLKRKLDPREIVHHKNRDKLDNRLENLTLMSWEEHLIEHAKEQTLAEESHRLCVRCGERKIITEFKIKDYTIVTKTPKRRMTCRACRGTRCRKDLSTRP